MTAVDEATEFARLILTLPGLPAEDRALRARRLVDQAKTTLSQVADEAVVELVKATSYREAAETLAVSESMINKAVTRHRARASKES
jgi:DNA-directed RNA polymerase specialized sigma24 family protein